MNKQQCILTLNGGSSTIRFALFQEGQPMLKLLHGIIDRIGEKDSGFTYNDEKGTQPKSRSMDASNHQSASKFLADWLGHQKEIPPIRAIGHRVVHGLNHIGPERITPELLSELRSIVLYDPDHLPGEIDLIAAFQQHYPNIPQFACFDTAFHSTMPRVAQLLPIPRRFDREGIRRYGFHGLSYAFLMEELARIAGAKAANGRIILMHLGNGASLAAVHKGRSQDTSMGFTPASGLVMGTRTGDLDPGVAWYLLHSEHLTPRNFNQLINHDSGLLGVSEISSDMRDLLEQETDDIRAAEAVALFCYQAKKWIGAFAAVLGGLDTLVFTAGIGEHSPVIRARICAGLGFLGIELDEAQNGENAPVISGKKGPVVVRVMHTDEESMIAKTVNEIYPLQ